MSSDPASAMGPFPSLLDALLEGLQVIDFDFRYLYLNVAAAQHGKADRAALVGRTMMECYPGIEHTEVFGHLRRCLEQRVSHVLENEFTYPDGSLAQFELRIEPVPQGLCVLSIDVSARKRAEGQVREQEQRLRHSERMEAIGLLSAGIAHDFNTLLSVMLGYCENALARPTGPDRSDLDAIMAAARRSADLTRQLLAFGRRQVMHSQVVDPALLLSDLERLLRRTLGADIELTVRVLRPLGSIEVDPSKFEQVVMNLVLNARDAMPRGGRITIELRNVELDEEHVRLHPGAHSGPHIMMTVSDTGSGMDAATQERIFEPFFTTKIQGKGTGLGLATVYGVVKQSGGNIWVYSELGHGTTFKIYLPRSHIAVTSIVPKPSATIVNKRSRSGVTVLVAEDDAMLRTLAEHTLEAAGYTVITAASGDEAFKICESSAQITILVTDIMMPGMRGTELISRARLGRPTLKILCTSGYGVNEIEGLRDIPQPLPFLEKPYLPSLLVRAVAEALDEPDEPS